jgi:hypothetical protein
MNSLTLTHCEWDPNGYWRTAIPGHLHPIPDWVHLFDQNGYDLTAIEILYSEVNGGHHSWHRNSHHVALKQPWFTQPMLTHGAVINHALLFERKAYQGDALEQLKSWVQQLPLIWKVIRMRPKWGLDFSIDWADDAGNVFEIFHYEFDSFDYAEIADLKLKLEHKFLNTDWDGAALELLRRKSEWHHLGFFEQSDYKCAFFGLPSERFKMVTWE